MRITRSIAVVGAALAAVSLASCAATTDEPASEEQAGPVEIDFWYSASGVPADVLVALVDEFNEAHEGEITVNPVFQGAYDESMAKLTTAVQGGDLPALIQGGDTFSSYLRDTGLTVAPGEVENRDGGTFTGDDLVPVVKNYYTFDGQLSSYPIMTSQPVIVYNRELLAAAGLDEDDQPESIADLFALAGETHEATGVAGVTMFIDPWWAEQFTASEGLPYCTPDNGVGEKPADAFQYTADPQLEMWRAVQDAVASGAMINTGTDGTASLNAFAAGQATFMVQSSRIYGDVLANAGFDFGIWPFPIGDDEGGAVPGGNSVWLVKEGNSDAEISAAATLGEFLASAESQTRIFEETGYLPTSLAALEGLSGSVSEVQQVMLDQFEATTSSVPSAGCHTGAMGEARTAVKAALEKIVGGEDVEGSLAAAEDAGNTAIESYNSRR